MAAPMNMAMQLDAGMTIAMPRPDGLGSHGRKPLGANFSRSASNTPRTSPTPAAYRADDGNASTPPANACDTPAHTTHDGAGHSSPPSTDGSGMMMVNAGTTTSA